MDNVTDDNPFVSMFCAIAVLLRLFIEALHG
jgi:hypothetical protein